MQWWKRRERIDSLPMLVSFPHFISGACDYFSETVGGRPSGDMPPNVLRMAYNVGKHELGDSSVFIQQSP